MLLEPLMTSELGPVLRVMRVPLSMMRLAEPPKLKLPTMTLPLELLSLLPDMLTAAVGARMETPLTARIASNCAPAGSGVWLTLPRKSKELTAVLPAFSKTIKPLGLKLPRKVKVLGELMDMLA